MENKYLPYSKEELQILLHEPWEVSDQPYKLHAAFALSCLFDLIAPQDSDSEDEVKREQIWGVKAPQKLIDRLAVDIKDDFNDAAKNYKSIRIWGRPYAIRKVNAYDKSRLHLIFNFSVENNEYTIVPEGVLNLVPPAPETLQPYEVSSKEAKANRMYVRKIIMLAEDDANDGWDKLTDMEIIIYLWALFYNKVQSKNLLQFKEEYKDYLYVTDSDISSCFNKRSAFTGRPESMYPFDVQKVQDWNEKHHQKSIAIDISDNDADDYWYEKALKSTFKPIDFK